MIVPFFNNMKNQRVSVAFFHLISWPHMYLHVPTSPNINIEHALGTKWCEGDKDPSKRDNGSKWQFLLNIFMFQYMFALRTCVALSPECGIFYSLVASSGSIDCSRVPPLDRILS